MKKAIILILMLLLGAIGLTDAQIMPSVMPYVTPNENTIDAPHNETNGFTCYDCHPNTPGTIVEYPDADTLCTYCHSNPNPGGYFKGPQGAPSVLTHSSDKTSTKYGNWSIRCIDCHWTQRVQVDQNLEERHGQLQLHKYGFDLSSGIYLVTGTIDSFTDDGTAYTTFTYSYPVENKAGWLDYSRWYQKSSNYFPLDFPFSGKERGVILIPDVNQPLVNFEVFYATNNTITVKGSLTSAFPGNTVPPYSTFAIIYGQFIRESVVDNNGIERPIIFFDNSGADSFAINENYPDPDLSPDGICQVCHTMTKYWRQDGTSAGDGVHTDQNGTNCMNCHSHKTGFGVLCYQCHGYPPIESVPNSLSTGGNSGLVEPSTGSQIAGAHGLHIEKGYDCEHCHPYSTGQTPTHPDNSVTIGFPLFGGDIGGGSYDGQTGVNYNAGTTDPLTTVSNNGSKQCGNIYCHSTGQGPTADDPAPSYSTPQWDNPATGACGTCHKTVTGSTLGRIDTGSHAEHLDSSSVVSGCADCHNGVSYDDSTYSSYMHADIMIDAR